MIEARLIRVQGTVQGVGFRPFVYRLAHQLGLRGWVNNAEDGVSIHVEGEVARLEDFIQNLKTAAPPAAQVARVEVRPAEVEQHLDFVIRSSQEQGHPTTRISPDLAVCEECLQELFDPHNRRYLYPYINCTNCGPRYSIITHLPYDRASTTMQPWPMCPACANEYHDPNNRRFHAQPIACPECGPQYVLMDNPHSPQAIRGHQAIQQVVQMLWQGKIVAIKGIGGYHLACDAQNAEAVQALRQRKFRKEKPFALMVKDLASAQRAAELNPESEALLSSVAGPIVIAPARAQLPGIAPNNLDLGLMLPYTPLHHLLFALGAPQWLVMTSANRSSEPIAYAEEGLETMAGIADAYLIGQRPIARRMDDSVTQATAMGKAVVRRSRGYAPAVVAMIPDKRPILAVGADLKNSMALAIDGQVLMSQFIGDLDHLEALVAHQQTIQDWLHMYEVDQGQLTIVCDLHPEYRSSQHALTLAARQHLAIQHHQAHIASVLAERGAYQTRVLGLAFDGSGYGLDGSIWGGEFFVGSLAEGFERVAHLCPALLPGGDAAARYPAQVAAGFLHRLNHMPDLREAPFNFPERYTKAQQLIQRGVQSFATTSVGRFFDCVAALLGYTGEISFEGQAAIWLEHLARTAPLVEAYPMPIEGQTLGYGELLSAIIRDRQKGRDPGQIARAFHRGLASSVAQMAQGLAQTHQLNTVVLSGGVFQNTLLLSDLNHLLAPQFTQIWVNQVVPLNDGGIGLGQIALALKKLV